MMRRSKEFCQGPIAHYKIPRYVKFVSGFPMSVTGKIRKFQDARGIDTGTATGRSLPYRDSVKNKWVYPQ